MVFGWFLVENLTHALPYSLAWRIHTRLGKNRHLPNRRQHILLATFLFPIRHILIPVEFLSNSFFAFGIGILPLRFLAASMISFSLSPFASPFWNFPPDLLALHIQRYSRSTQPRFQQLDRYSMYLRSSVVALAIRACMRRIEMVCVIQCLKWRHCTQSRLIFDFLYQSVWDYHISLESLNPNTLNTRLNKSSLRETLHLFERFYTLYYLLAI